MSDPENYTVGWICAISTEYVAAQAFLDEKHDGARSLDRHNKNDYTLGRIGKHNVVIAVLPMGEYGTASASHVAQDMMHSFPNIRIGLMVGIGGGAPSKRNDIRLGDIVISMPSNDGRGGVLQYDFGKTIQSQSFQPTGFLDQPPTILRAAVSGLNAQYEAEDHREKVNAVLAKKPRLRKRYRQPPYDRLYQSQIIHMEGSDCAKDCGDDQASLIMREPRTESDDDPAIHYGLIASANQLMKDALIRDTLTAEKNVLCFEMEAAGLMNHFPCLVIRGICDYSDTHKNKEWQGYAAMVAAAYAKDLLCRIVPQQVEAEGKLQETLNCEYSDDMGENHTDNLSKFNDFADKRQDGEQEEILFWLTPLDFSPLQNDLISRKQEGTGEWLPQSSEYQQWESTRGSILFCPGIPGAGKTMTACFVVDHLRQKSRKDQSFPVIFLYCNYKRQQEMRPIDLFSSLLKQLSRHASPIADSVITLYEKHKPHQSRPSLQEILRDLVSAIQSFPKTFIVIDALDEYEASDRVRFMTKLFEVIEETNANLLATSRFVATLPPFVLENTPLQDFIKQEIVEAASGMFLLAQLHLGSLCGLRSPRAVKTALKNLRKGVDAYGYAYDEAMQRIEAQVPGSRDLAMEVLSWIVLAERPLSLAELLHALAIEIGESSLDEENFSDVDHFVSVCLGLVVVDEESEIVRLIHYTAQEYFKRAKKKLFPEGQNLLTSKCVTYLTFDAFHGHLCKDKDDLDKRTKLYPLFNYAARNWGKHAFLSSIDGQELILRLLEDMPSVSACNHAMSQRPRMFAYNLTGDFFGFGRIAIRLQGIHLAAVFGLSKTIKKMLDRNVSCESQDGDERTVLSFAAEAGHEDVVNILLDRGALIDPRDREGRTPLEFAAGTGKTAVIKTLLDRGAFVNSNNRDGRSPLHAAAAFGHIDAVRLLLDRNADVNHESEGIISTPLCEASHGGYADIWGHEAVVKVLIGMNADCTIRDYDSWDPLSRAVTKNYPNIVNILLDYHNNVNDRDRSGTTALMWAARGIRGVEMMKLLIDRGANVNFRNREGRTALSLASEKGQVEAVRLLLEKGAVIETKDKKDQTALSYASENGHSQIVDLLLQQGADIKNCGQKRTPRMITS
ncbi:hypothetical protein BJX99DRAFT_266432 [Aspergillus californicus]